MDDKYIGPALPPHLEKNDSKIIGPVLPPHLQKTSVSEDEDLEEKLMNLEEEQTRIVGPALPPHLLKTSLKEDDELEEEETGIVGPALPPHLLLKKKTEILGPALPPHLQTYLLSQGDDESEEEEVYGPLPPSSTKLSRTQLALEERALQLKMDQLEPQTSLAPVREEWMVELPEVKASNLGLGPRQFRRKAGPDLSDRSSWTSTPNEAQGSKPKKVEPDLKKETELKEIKKRDAEQERMAKKLKKKNKESLLEMHQKEIKKKKKDEGPSERRPFSRDIDLKVNRFDEAQKKAVLKKAQLLDNRFSSGQSKFL